MVAFSSQRGFLSSFFAITLFLQAALASHAIKHVERNPEAMAAHLHETRDLLQSRADNIAITGVQGSVAPRLEVRDLAANGDAWNLYLLGLERFKSKPQNDPLSYYQVAGVHGVPYVSWNNYALKHTAGYCPHAQTLFGTWHRPYLGVYEQAWYACVQEVLNEFPQSERDSRWNAAAANLRMPFWDWAKAPPSGECTVPSLITDQKVTVEKPNQGRVEIDNPLYQYSWGSSLPSEIGGGPNRNNPFTLRHPVAGNPYTSNNAEFCSDVNNNRISLRDRVYGIFSSRAATGDVTSEQVGVRTNQNGGNPDSFESVHDLIHVLTGGGSANGNDGGHMWYLDWSSFDPVFWLHHTNIDRLIAMYQTLGTNGNLVTGGRFNQDRAQYNNGDFVDGNSPLWPFRKSTGDDYYTSEDVRSTNVLGYVYPETGDGANAQSVGQVINDLYGPNANNNPSRAVSSSVSRLQTSTRAASSSASTGVSSGSSRGASTGASSNGSSGSSTAGASTPSGSARASSTAVSSGDSSPSGSAGSSGGSSGGSTGFPGKSSTPTTGRQGASATGSSGSRPTSGNGGNSGNHGSGGNGGHSGQYPGRPFEDGDYHTICSITANKYALDGSYIIHFFLGGGKKSSNSSSSFPFKNSTSSGGSYASREGFIGSFAVLGMSHRANSSVTPVEIQASIPLTSALQGKQASGELKSLGPDDVTDYLKQHFSYIVTGKGGEIDPQSISGLHFGVSTAKVTAPKSSSELPSFGKFEDLPKVTENMPCGLPYTPNPSVPYNPTPAGPSNGSNGGSGGGSSGGSNGGSSTSKPTGALPSQFPSYGGGQCQISKTVVYVDENGKFLYQEVGSPK